MSNQYKHTATGTIHHPGDVVQGVRTRRGMSPEAWADLGCVPYTSPPVEPLPVPPAHWSKYSILTALAGLGLAEEFLGILKSDALLYDLWLAAGDIAEDNRHFAQALPILLAALGLTEAEAMELLDGCRI